MAQSRWLSIREKMIADARLVSPAFFSGRIVENGGSVGRQLHLIKIGAVMLPLAQNSIPIGSQVAPAG
jgi:hypothetical protein